MWSSLERTTILNSELGRFQKLQRIRHKVNTKIRDLKQCLDRVNTHIDSELWKLIKQRTNLWDGSKFTLKSDPTKYVFTVWCLDYRWTGIPWEEGTTVEVLVCYYDKREDYEDKVLHTMIYGKRRWIRLDEVEQITY